jgi:hypothetical protein
LRTSDTHNNFIKQCRPTEPCLPKAKSSTTVQTVQEETHTSVNTTVDSLPRIKSTKCASSNLPDSATSPSVRLSTESILTNTTREAPTSLCTTSVMVQAVTIMWVRLKVATATLIAGEIKQRLSSETLFETTSLFPRYFTFDSARSRKCRHLHEIPDKIPWN